MGISFLLIMNVTCNENYCLKFFGLWVHRANYFFADCFRVTCKKFDVFYCILAIRILGLSDRNNVNLMKKPFSKKWVEQFWLCHQPPKVVFRYEGVVIENEFAGIVIRFYFDASHFFKKETRCFNLFFFHEPIVCYHA